MSRRLCLRLLSLTALLAVVVLIPATSVLACDFTNATPITIADNAAATPYPSTITVSGRSGTVTSVTVFLFGLTHPAADDLDILLVAPTGETVMLMSDVAGNAANVNLTFDNWASNVVDPAVSGTYRPLNNTTPDAMPAPAPAEPYGTAFSVFTGINPNGVWSLFVYDDTATNTGTIAGGWGIDVGTTGGSSGSSGQSSTTWFRGHQDGRLNARELYYPVALFVQEYSGGALGLHIYNIGSGSSEPWLIVTPEMIAAVEEEPEENTLIIETPDGHIRVYRLTTGWFQIMVGPNAEGKISILFLERLCNGNGCANYRLEEICTR